MSKKENGIKEKIEEIRLLLQDTDKTQMFLNFNDKERIVIIKLSKALGIPKGEAIGIACRYLLGELTKKDNEEI